MKTIKVDLDFLEFIKTGKFGFIKLGENKTEIESQGLPAENWINGKSKENSRIWRYGNIEFHFNEKNELIQIFNDYISEINGGESFFISDFWIFPNNGEKPSLLKTMKELNFLNIDFMKKTYEVGIIEIKLKNGVYFSFYGNKENKTESPNNWKMCVIGKK
ncbi:hypothetical protein [Polaribacter atrinae]|uniref:Uncharacterized protein n=1 Tax=Polaribacter atrinae TaxID=1333662 RepID=A0A176SXA3_9FLAO|nr:hypothetical protein [Polaribacter atrinae]OAD40324.1 hypothetical protein LPB303_16895 [Polaribacter atrinae]